MRSREINQLASGWDGGQTRVEPGSLDAYPVAPGEANCSLAWLCSEHGEQKQGSEDQVQREREWFGRAGQCWGSREMWGHKGPDCAPYSHTCIPVPLHRDTLEGWWAGRRCGRDSCQARCITFLRLFLFPKNGVTTACCVSPLWKGNEIIVEKLAQVCGKKRRLLGLSWWKKRTQIW